MRNRRKFEIEEARNNDGTYQAIKLFAKNTRVVVLQMPDALKLGYMDFEYERDNKPSGIANKTVEFFAMNFDLRDRIYFIRAEILRMKCRRYFALDNVIIKGNVKYIRVSTSELSRYD